MARSSIKSVRFCSTSKGRWPLQGLHRTPSSAAGSVSCRVAWVCSWAGHSAHKDRLASSAGLQVARIRSQCRAIARGLGSSRRTVGSDRYSASRSAMFMRAPEWSAARFASRSPILLLNPSSDSTRYASQASPVKARSERSPPYSPPQRIRCWEDRGNSTSPALGRPSLHPAATFPLGQISWSRVCDLF